MLACSFAPQGVVVLRAVKPLCLFYICALLGCNVTAGEQENTPATAEHLAALDWVKTANVEEDARAAQRRGDYQLLALAGRGEQLPGLPIERVEYLKQQCGVRYLSGSTDVIRDQAHLQLLLQVSNYAAQYNQLMVKDCQ